jgi:hypothetical protein
MFGSAIVSRSYNTSREYLPATRRPASHMAMVATIVGATTRMTKSRDPLECDMEPQGIAQKAALASKALVSAHTIPPTSRKSASRRGGRPSTRAIA